MRAIPILDYQAIECEECGHLNFMPFVIKDRCTHCRKAFDYTEKDTMLRESPLCADCKKIIEKHRKEDTEWANEFWHLERD